MCAMPDRISIVGPGLRVDGHLVGDGSVEVHGHFEGSVHIGGDLVVTAGAMVRADVLAARVLVAGTLIGTVRATHAVRVSATGELQGTVEGPLHVEDGGVYRGRMTPGRVRPSKTVNTRRRRPISAIVAQADQQTEAGLPAVGPTPPLTASASLAGTGEFDPPSNSDIWLGDAPPRRPAPLAITEGEPPTFSVSHMPSISAEQVALRLGREHRDAGPITGEVPPAADEDGDRGPDPTELPRGPTRLAIPDPPRRRTTAPGVSPFRQAFGEALTPPRPTAAVPAPRPASVSGRHVPVVRAGSTGPVAAPSTAEPDAVRPDQDPDLSDSWFLDDDEELRYP